MTSGWYKPKAAKSLESLGAYLMGIIWLWFVGINLRQNVSFVSRPIKK